MKFLCKECWIQHDVDTLLAGCEECGSRVRDRLEPLTSRHDRNEFTRTGVFVCRHHRHESLKIVCSSCREPVPSSGTVGDRTVLAVVGDTFSGKTSLMWVVTARLHRDRNDGVSIQRPIGNSDTLLWQSVEHIFTDGNHRGTTRSDADIHNYAWELKLPTGAAGNWLLAFHDAAGEVWRELAQLRLETYPALRRFLKIVGGVVFAIDGEKLLEALRVPVGGVGMPDVRFAEEYELRIAEALGQRFRPREVRIPVAVTVTKADVLWNEVEWKLFRPDSNATRQEIDKAVQQLLRRTGRGPLLDTLGQWFAPLSFFAVSAFGRRPTPGFTVQDVHSSRVEEPIVSILNA